MDWTGAYTGGHSGGGGDLLRSGGGDNASPDSPRSGDVSASALGPPPPDSGDDDRFSADSLVRPRGGDEDWLLVYDDTFLPRFFSFSLD